MGMVALETTFGMIKPEFIERNLVSDIEQRIYDAGLVIEEQKEIVMTHEQFESLYGHIKEKRPAIYEPLKNYMMGNAVKVLKISGDNAVEVLLGIRGSSNPSDAAPGTIRGDYAKGQDYTELYKQGKPSLNVFHASDSKEEAAHMLNVFFGEDK